MSACSLFPQIDPGSGAAGWPIASVMFRLFAVVEDTLGLDKLSVKDLGMLGILMVFCGYLIIRVLPAKDKAHVDELAKKDSDAAAARKEFLDALEKRDTRFSAMIDAKDKLLSQQWQDRNEGDVRWRNALSDTVKSLSDSMSKSCKAKD